MLPCRCVDGGRLPGLSTESTYASSGRACATGVVGGKAARRPGRAPIHADASTRRRGACSRLLFVKIGAGGVGIASRTLSAGQRPALSRLRGPDPPGPDLTEARPVLDVVYVLLSVAVFGLLTMLVRAVGKL